MFVRVTTSTMVIVMRHDGEVLGMDVQLVRVLGIRVGYGRLGFILSVG